MFNCLTKGCVLAVYLCSFASATGAKTLTIPASWQNPTSNLSRQSRESLAYEAALPLVQMVQSMGNPVLPFGQDTINVYALLALQDYYSGNTTWRSIGTNNLQAFIQRVGFWFGGPISKGGDQGIDSIAAYLGLALFYSYRTYKEQDLRDTAVDVWNLIYSGAFITPGNAVSGTGAGRNVSFSPPVHCPGGTFAGGVFGVYNASNNTYVDMNAVGPFATLSAYLFEETKNATYQQTAQLSLDFVLNHLWSGSIVYPGMTLNSCEIGTQLSTVDQAWFVEVLSVWANITQNSTLSTLLESAVLSITTFSSWSLPNGVVNDTNLEPISQGNFVRGLAEARRRNPDTELARYIEAYITVQFNAVLNNARAPAPNDSYYSRPWNGPPTTPFGISGNIAALDVLNAAFDLGTSSRDPPSGGSTPTATNASNSAKSSKTGVIAGGVVGGAVVTVAIVVTALWCRQRRARANEVNDAVGPRSVEPFISRTPHNPPTLNKSERVNEAYQDGAPSLQAPYPVVPISNSIEATSNAINDQELDMPPIQAAEITSLSQRSNDIFQGRHDEPPPRYDEQT